LEKGSKALAEVFSCTDCHKFHDKGEGGAPDLSGYGSKDWIVRMITNPEHADFYGKSNDRMPAFQAKAGAAKPSLMTREEIELVARWLRGEIKPK
jgi:ubiquinol-cytochrome c reductase cytochrome b subunit